ncbi:MAG: hypothetical protein ACKO9Z_11330 [Planctomycetota bacterium]
MSALKNHIGATPIDLLRGLASGLCHDARITVEESPGQNWAYDPDRNVILVGSDDLRRKGVLPCAAILAHETAHFHISRYNMYRFEHRSVPILRIFFNALEDPRVNNWIQGRYPGTRRWFQSLLAAEGFIRCALHGPEHMVFGLRNCAEALMGWDTSRMPVIRSARLAGALERTAKARRAFSEILPGNGIGGGGPAESPGRPFLAEVAPRLLNPVPAMMTAREQEVHLFQMRAVQLALQEILPAFDELLEADTTRLAQAMHKEPSLLRMAHAAANGNGGQALGQMAIGLGLRLCPDPDESLTVSSQLHDLALRLLEGCCSGQGMGTGGCDSPRRANGKPRPASARRPSGAGPCPPPRPMKRQESHKENYESTRGRLEPQIRRLVSGIEDVLTPRRRLREERGHASGHRLDMREVIRFEADPRRHDRLWCRRNIPNRRELAVSLLVDLSGSMSSNGKIQAAFAGTVLLVEMLHRLKVPFAVNGFQDKLVPFCEPGGVLTPELIDKLSWMPAETNGARPGGNNNAGINDDGPCLLAAAEQLSAFPATHRLLICVSDGEPAGPGDCKRNLRQAVSTISSHPAMALVGLGLGNGTDHVSKYYPRHIANVPENQFADRIGRVLIETLMAL